MTQQLGIADTAPYGRAADAFVILSVTVLSLALGAWFLIRLGLTLWWGMVVAMAIYATLLSVHLLVRRSFMDTDVVFADDSVDWLSSTSDPQLQQRGSAERVPGTFEQQYRDVEAGGWPADPMLPEPAPTTAADPFAFRPARDALFEKTASERSEPRAAADASESEMSVEVIQDLIKKLADELNAEPRRADAPKPERATEATERTARDVELPGKANPASRDALHSQPASWWPRAELGGPKEPAGSGIPPVLNPQLARIAEAVAAERMDVLLEPIHALAEGRPHHFEVSVRLLTEDGAAFEQRDFARIAVGSGLMPRIDAARMIRAARVARRLGERGREGSVLATVAGESLTDDVFLDTAAQQPGAQAAMRLVLSFAQSEVRAFTPGHVQALAAMAAAGFGFALQDVTDLDMDFGALAAMGFEFVELDAPVFLDGLPAAGGRVPAADICRFLAEFGLTLVVGRIEDDWLLARILGFGVVFGKGTLFGGPKLVKPEVVAGPANA